MAVLDIQAVTRIAKISRICHKYQIILQQMYQHNYHSYLWTYNNQLRQKPSRKRFEEYKTTGVPLHQTARYDAIKS